MSKKNAPKKDIKDSYLNVRISQHDSAQLHAIAHSQGLKLSGFVRRLIDGELLDYEKSNKLSSDAEEYLSAYQNEELN